MVNTFNFCLNNKFAQVGTYDEYEGLHACSGSSGIEGAPQHNTRGSEGGDGGEDGLWRGTMP